MVFRTQGVGSGQLVEHRSTPLSRWLRAKRLRIAAWIAVGEGVLVLIHAVPRLLALVLAAAEAASRKLAPVGGTWITLPAWYV